MLRAPVTGEIKKIVHLRYPNYAGTGGGLVFNALMDGSVAAIQYRDAPIM
jgi:hypothetical protein